ncbi:Uncharacterized protein dnm_053970 [Desulfonema magnum]|uniref:Uncharacterized protein n=1 Tax=Desulfonema magnum TaxID=45655 RepID=A0A975BPJ8_9BACT|nr:Uncharacterized protein dnm_053970 [Desulfonema magnum]
MTIGNIFRLLNDIPPFAQADVTYLSAGGDRISQVPDGKHFLSAFSA